MPTTSVSLKGIIPNEFVRRVMYSVYVLAGLFFGAMSVWYPAIDMATPEWVTGWLQVMGYLAIPFGTLALANVPALRVAEEKIEQEESRLSQVADYSTK